MSSISADLIALAFVIALAVTWFGLAALWFATSNRHWFWRSLVLLGLFGSLVLIPAHDLVLLFSAQAITVVVPLLILQWTKSADETGRAQSSARVFQVSMRDLLLAAMIAPPVFAELVYLAPLTIANWWRWVATGASFGAIVLATMFLVYHKGSWGKRCLVTAVVVPLTGLLGSLASPAVTTSWSIILGEHSLRVMHVLLSAAMLAGALWLVSAAGWIGGPSKRTGRGWYRCAALCLGTLAAVSLLTIYYELAKREPIVAVALPTPNAFDGLHTAANGIDWTAIPDQDSETASMATLKTFVNRNRRILDSARVALQGRSVVPLAFDASDDQFPHIEKSRALTRAFEAESNLARLEGRVDDELRCHLDQVRLGSMLPRGGLILDRLVGYGCQGIGVHGVDRQVGNLDADACRRAIKGVLAAEAEWEPLDVVEKRDQVWEHHAHGWQGRLWNAIDKWFGTGDWELGEMGRIENRNVAALRLLACKLALRLYRLEHGAEAESLAELVPKYLPSVPADPFGNGPLVYRVTDRGVLLYSVGPDGQDDNGAFDPAAPWALEAGADLSLESLHTEQAVAATDEPGEADE